MYKGRKADPELLEGLLMGGTSVGLAIGTLIK